MSTVLVVDDDPMVRKLIRRTLEKEGFTILEAADGKQCMEIYRKTLPEVVLVDIIMPEKDGLTAIREIKSINAQASVIAISGGLVLIPQAYLDAATETGADYSLSKPIDRKELVFTVNRCLNNG